MFGEDGPVILRVILHSPVRVTSSSQKDAIFRLLLVPRTARVGCPWFGSSAIDFMYRLVEAEAQTSCCPLTGWVSIGTVVEDLP